jgi:TrmH family RNA methyltransferase
VSRFAELPSAKASLIRDLLRKKRTRDSERAFVIEGPKPIRELHEADQWALLATIVTPTWLDACEAPLRRTLERSTTPVFVCLETVLQRITDVTTSPGILAVVRRPQWDQEDVFRRRALLGLFGECLQDPANVGAIIRTAAAFSFDAVWLSADSADIFNPKVVRATAGTLLKLPVFITNDAGLFTRHHCALLASVTPRPNSRSIRDITTRPHRAILAFGNEGRGLSESTLERAALEFHIPVSGMIESLNVATSTAIAAFHFSALPRKATV